MAGNRWQWPIDQSLRWPALVLLPGIAVLVALLMGLVWSSQESNIRAHQDVIESVRVRLVACRMVLLIRDAESDLYKHLRDPTMHLPDDPAELRSQASALLATLTGMEPQIPELRPWIETARVTAAGRLQALQDALADVAAGHGPQALQRLDRARSQYPVEPDISDVASTFEQWAQEVRTMKRIAEQRKRMLIGCAVLQLLLIAVIVSMAWRYARRHEQAQRRVQEAEYYSSQIVQTVREPMVLLDRELLVLQMNTAFCEIYGIDARRVVGHRLSSLGSGVWEDSTLLERLDQVLSYDRELWDYELVQQSPDGGVRYVMINARRLVQSVHQEPALLLTVSDITSRAYAERQVRELNRQLQSKVALVSDINRELEAFTYSISHDLRAPLRHISQFADKLVLHLDGQEDAVTRRYMDAIVSASSRMAELIDDLLVFSRLGRGTLRAQTVNMQRLVGDVCELLQTEEGGHAVQWLIAPLPEVTGDESMLRTVWQNLLGNALKYSARRETPVVEVSARKNERGDCEFMVRDNGTGFDMRYANKLFGVFQRLHRASEFSGNGIGLASVQRIIARHGGQVWASSEPQQGASFFFTLPQCQGQQTVSES